MTNEQTFVIGIALGVGIVLALEHLIFPVVISLTVRLSRRPIIR